MDQRKKWMKKQTKSHQEPYENAELHLLSPLVQDPLRSASYVPQSIYQSDSVSTTQSTKQIANSSVEFVCFWLSSLTRDSRPWKLWIGRSVFGPNANPPWVSVGQKSLNRNSPTSPNLSSTWRSSETTSCPISQPFYHRTKHRTSGSSNGPWNSVSILSFEQIWIWSGVSKSNCFAGALFPQKSQSHTGADNYKLSSHISSIETWRQFSVTTCVCHTHDIERGTHITIPGTTTRFRTDRACGWTAFDRLR